MFRLKRFPHIVVSFYIIGYIFAFFALFYRSKLVFALITFAVSGLLNFLHFTSDEYRSSQYMIRAKKKIDKGETEQAVDLILKAAKIRPNEDMLVQINAVAKKHPEHYEAVADLLSKRLAELDTPFVRFVASSFYYSSHKIQKANEMLINVPLDQMSIKAVRLLGSVLYEQEEYAKAIKVFSRYNPPAVPANEDQLAILYGIAICHIAKKESKKAIEFLTRIRAKSPKYGNADKLISQLEEDLK